MINQVTPQSYLKKIEGTHTKNNFVKNKQTQC